MNDLAGAPGGRVPFGLDPRPMKHSTAALEPDALVAELERARAELLRAERQSRTYLVRRGVLDHTRLDLVDALKRIAAGVAEVSQRLSQTPEGTTT